MQETQIKTVDDQQRSPAPKTQSRRLLKLIKQKQSSFKFFNWDVLQNYAYITYLTNFRYVFESSAERKRVRVFHHITKLIKTRNAHQVKSHHQKMLLRHKSIDEIVQFIRYRVTRELTNSPDLIPKIAEINVQAQEFFRNAQMSKPFVQTQARRTIGRPTSKTTDDIKKEQDSLSYEVEVKKEQNDSGFSESSELYCLQEEEQDMIRRV